MSALVDMNNEYESLTGEEVYLYASTPGDNLGTRYVFVDGTVFGQAKAEGYMQALLDAARKGKSHSDARQAVTLPR
ncbi:hypothetical protein [Streptomyces sp. MP131-18]|uniref:hypothetical protein n=1 Tax=Streptomyces sp. MP131-18 TaxID=1857892 RepID=UPI00097C171C|nr:hypothetical protein [Streptomyces sp. MP131-18]ONK10394.1 hypothetical protein STBA_11160 [Streptomyces sp. MP131-18]